jgi:hypothetical protein
MRVVCCERVVGTLGLRYATHTLSHTSLPPPPSGVAVDDTEAVWRGARNLIVIEPYKFWTVREDNKQQQLSPAWLSTTQLQHLTITIYTHP